MKLTFLAAALAVVGFAGAAGAATCNSPGAPAVKYTLTQGSPDKVLGAACFGGNDTNTIDSNFSLFGKTGWTLADKSSEAAGDGKLSFGVPKPVGDQTLWSILNPLGYTEIIVTLKQSNSFAVFLLDTAEALSGVWDTAGPGRAEDDLSHASVYYRGAPGVVADPNISPVPLPAAGLLLIGGLGALVAARRKKS